MQIARRTLAGVLGVSLAWACSSGSGTGGGVGGGNIPLEDLPEAYASTICDNIGPCCQQEGLTHDAAQCRAMIAGLMSQIVGQVQSGKVKYDGSAAGQCLQAAKPRVAACDLNLEIAACDTVFTGTVPEGGSCTDSEECIAPAGAETDCDNGICVVEKRGVAGDTCKWTCEENQTSTICSGSGADTGARCFVNDGLYCDGTTEVCTQQHALGATGCGFDDDACVAGAYCESDTCVAQIAVGGACSGFGSCVDSAYCDNGTCAAQKPIGSSCTSSTECLDGGCENGACAAGFSGLSFFCGS